VYLEAIVETDPGCARNLSRPGESANNPRTLYPFDAAPGQLGSDPGVR
jgi:hypothetical protein